MTKKEMSNDAKMDKLIKDHVKKELAEKKKKGLPIAKYDMEARRVYRERPDGTKEYV